MMEADTANDARATPDAELAKIVADPQSVQAGAWLAGVLRHNPRAVVSDVADPRGVPDPNSDVPIPDWPFAPGDGRSRQVLEALARAGLLERVGAEAFCASSAGRPILAALPLYHARNREGYEAAWAEFVDTVAGRRVLDAGCGVGAGTRWLVELGARHVVALDHSAERLGVARRLAPCAGRSASFVRASVECLPLQDGCVDRIFSRVVLPYVNHRRSLSEFARVLAPGGLAMLILHAPSFYLRSLLRIRPTVAGVREAAYSVFGLLGGAALERLGREPRWRSSRRGFHLAYERRGTMARLVEQCGMELVRWVPAGTKPIACLRKGA
ncbi:MAG: methyltransferase domain-containing protein [Phycisphaerae bacterium]|nr:methyltransferase domain-containing protein [Phycisphaerae bacterium]